MIVTSAGVGFTIPSSTVLTIAPQLIQFKKRINITYQVDAVIGTANLPLPLPQLAPQEIHNAPILLPGNVESPGQSTSATLPPPPEVTPRKTGSAKAPEPTETPSPPKTRMTPEDTDAQAMALNLNKPGAPEMAASNLESQKRPFNE